MNRACLGPAPGHPCPYRRITSRTRCPSCATAYDKQRRGSPTERYGPGYQRRHREVVATEPWCHYPDGCAYPITRSNPLTAQHSHAASRYGPFGPLEPWCKRHNSAQGNRPGAG